MKIWIFQTGEPLFTDKKKYRPMRAMNLTKLFTDNGHEVRIITSNFFHQEKKFRYIKEKEIQYNKLVKINFIHSTGYYKNTSIKRFIDHVVVSYNLYKFLKKQKSYPDFAIIGYPPPEFAYIAASWLKKNNIKFTLDIKDFWPLTFNNYKNYLLQFVFYIYRYLFYKTMLKTSFITTMSKSLSNYLIKKFSIKKKYFELPLVNIFENQKINNSKKIEYKKVLDKFIKKNSKVFFFIGSFTKSFNFLPILNIAKQLEKEQKNIKFIMCGYNELFNKMKNNNKNLTNILFLERTNTATNKYISIKSHGALAPYNNFFDFEKNIPNKIYDYLAFNKKIITPLKGDTQKFLKKNKAGFFYNDEKSLKRILINYKNQKNNFNKIIIKEKMKFYDFYKYITKNYLTT